MEGSDGSPPQSLCMIRAAELFPKPQMEKEDTELTVPFQELSGESVKFLGRTDDGIYAISNYRIFLLKSSTNSETSVPLSLIDTVHIRDLFHLILSCKDASTVKCSFETAEQCSEAQRRIQLSVGVPETLESLFAFPFCSWTSDALSAVSPPIQNGIGLQNLNSNVAGAMSMGIDNLPTTSTVNFPDYIERLQRTTNCEDEMFLREVERLGFDLKSAWRISNANEEFKLCASYPQKILVPSCIPDDVLQKVASFRGSRRLPVVVWRHRKSGAILARCSQPEVGWLGWRNAEDEMLLKAIADASAFDRGEECRRLPQASNTNAEQTNGNTHGNGAATTTTTTATANAVNTVSSATVAATATATTTMPTTNNVSDGSTASSPDGSHEEVPLDLVRKVLIVDARSYTSAVTNRARGGGCECIEYYTCAEIEFMNLGNIHAIRKSFHALRQLFASPADSPNWLTMLEKTMWFQHLSGLLAATVTICHNIERRGRPVLVHCSDGWDRTPQLVATAQLCLDPYYRTVEGFRVLVEREWLSFGHKFADRCGHGPGSDELNERCPVFLQWLDLVHQIHKQFSCSFEFSMGYLIKLAQHSHSCLFGTFLCNTLKERVENSVFERTFSVWPFLSGPMYKNPLYVPNRDKVLWPRHNVRDLELWTEVYLGSLGNRNCSDIPTCNASEGSLNGSMSPVAKTRSYGDLITASILQNGISRRSSDPNMSVEPNLTIATNSENTSVGDFQSEREDSPDIIANLIHDTTRKLQNLTIELNSQNDDESLAATANSSKQINTTTTTTTKGNNTENNLDTFYRRFQEPIKQTSIDANDDNVDDDSNADKHDYSDTNEHAETIKTNMSSSSLTKFDATNQTKFQPQQQEFGCESFTISDDIKNATENLNNNINDETTTLNHYQNGFDCSSNNSNFDCNNQTTTATNGVSTSSSYEKLTSVMSSAGSITIHKTGDINLDMMQSVDLSGVDSFSNSITGLNGYAADADCPNAQNMWHGSINTSTDTLVPIENSCINYEIKPEDKKHATTDDNNDDDIDGVGCSSRARIKATILTEFAKENSMSNSRDSSSSSILPKVHNHNKNRMNNFTNTTAAAAQTATSSSNDVSSVSSSASSSLNNLHKINFNEHVLLNQATTKTNSTENILANYIDDDDQQQQHQQQQQLLSNNNLMDESILILPEHQKLDISLSGKYEIFSNSNVANATTQTMAASAAAVPFGQHINSFTPASSAASSSSYSHAPSYTVTASTQRRRRTSSSNSKRNDVLNGRPIFAGASTTIPRYPLTGGIRSLPMTPPGLVTERPQIAISCPDGLAHGLNEQNLRLQQIVLEHKLREDALLREIHEMRMVLLKKICPSCNNATNPNDEQCSTVDNVENVSVCSWEAVEDRSGPSSCTSSSMQASNTATSVLWVPDHAVSRCTSCQTEFWLGRRKHHCRSCGQIFCADCSEFWAPLPDEKLFSPVRLCGSCYHAVTTRMQLNQQLQHKAAFLQAQQQQQQQQQHASVERNKLMTQPPPFNHLHHHTSAAVTTPSANATAAAAVVSVSNATLMTATSQA